MNQLPLCNRYRLIIKKKKRTTTTFRIEGGGKCFAPVLPKVREEKYFKQASKYSFIYSMI
jgi:hypothetical protein